MITITNKIRNLFLRNTLLQHLLFWSVSGYVLLNIFTLSSSYQQIDYIYTVIFMLSLAIPVELNLIVFIPRFLNQKKYAAYLLVFVSSLFIFSLFNQVLFSRWIDFLLPGYYFISYFSFSDILKFFLVFMVITTLLHLSKEWFELKDASQKMMFLEKEKIDAELKALANQVNPHFLFNSLNVLYSLTMNNRKEAPEAILKLSDLLRYVIYDSSTEQVTVDAEVKMIHDFIDLQRFRTNPDAAIHFDTDIDDGQMKIAPMLCLPLVENSFKHGLKGDVKDTFVKINLITSDDQFRIIVENNKGTVDRVGGNGSGGVGLKNIRNRLELIYPGKHSLLIIESGVTFRVEMEINLG
ncbi:MAG: sensor histidine kinase [Bacteroidetes bacterium]|nr:sensor histidine kinase [Bacteroidota bacterium]